MKNLISLHPNQSKIFLSNSINRVLVAGRKFGKSTLALAELLRSAMTNRNNVYIAPTYKMAKNTLWKDHINKFLPYGLIKDKNETELSLTLNNGNLITLYGADDPDRLRGGNWDFDVLDEFQDFKPSSWEYVIEPNLLTTKGRTLFMGTPKGKRNILYEQYNIHDSIYEPWHFTSFDNPLNDKIKLEATRTRLINSGKENVWKQEYMAEFTVLAGIIYDNWNRETHLIELKDVGECVYGFSVDRGMESPSAVSFYQIYRREGESRFYLYDEIYKAGLSPQELTEQIKQKMGNRDFPYQFCDPSAKDFMATANENGLSIQPANKETGGKETGWVINGIGKCKEWLAKSPLDGKPKITISPKCKNFVEEIESYIWEEEMDETPNDRPRKLNDHLLDSWRYFVCSYEKPLAKSLDDYNFPKQDLFKKGFY